MNSGIKSFRDLNIWKQGIEIVKDIYKITQTFPKSERYGLCSQMQRAAVYIPSNIAEGHIRSKTKEFLYFLRIAISSCAELETQLVIALELGYISTDSYNAVLKTIVSESKQIRALSAKLSKS